MLLMLCLERNVLISALSTKFLGFEHLKVLYAIDVDFSTTFDAREEKPFDKFYNQDRYLFQENKLCISSAHYVNF